MKVKIIKASRPLYWYASKIGEEFLVTESPTNPDKYNAGQSIGWIDKVDCQLVSWGIDAAWDHYHPEQEPLPNNTSCAEAVTYHAVEKINPSTYYTYPTTKEITVKKTIEQLAIEVLQNTTGKTYTEREIIAIVAIVNSIKSLENYE